MINIVVAQDEARNIGYQNKLLCRLSSDMEHFKELTIGKFVVMGRKTLESIGRPLPYRFNVILSKSLEVNGQSLFVLDGIERILHYAENNEVYIIGGESVYKQFLPYANRIYLTQIHHIFENADTKFPILNINKWEVVDFKEYQADEKNEYDFTIKVLERV